MVKSSSGVMSSLGEYKYKYYFTTEQLGIAVVLKL